MNSFRAKPDRGFSLMEMLIVVAIMGILGALAMPMMSKTRGSKLRAAAKLVVADLEYAQAESIAHGDDLRVVVVNSTSTYTIATVANPNTAITDPVTKRAYATTFGSGRAAPLAGVTISTYSLGGDNKLGFGMYGQLDQAADATLTLACDGSTVVITYNASTGQASIGNIQ